MRSVVVLVLAALVGVLTPAALANWSSTVFGGAMTVSTASLDDPTALAAANNKGNCARSKAKSLQIDLSWTATSSPRAAGYTVLRNGAQVGTVGSAAATGWTDTTKQLAFSTSYTYTVESTVGGWTSPGASVAVTTLNNRCR